MKRIFIFLLLVSALGSGLIAQVGIGILTPDSTAILHLDDTTRGFLLTRMNSAQRNAIAAPAHGLTIFNVEDSTIQYWNGVCWLSVYQENCTDCFFDAQLSSIHDTLDRVIADSVTVTLTLLQTAGTPTQVAFNVLGILPPGMTWTANPNPAPATGNADITFHVTPFTPAGTYVFVVQALCGGDIENLIYTITVLPCYELHVFNNTLNYNVTTDFYNTYPAVPAGQPVCVIAYVDPGVLVASLDTLLPAHNTGTLPPGSILAVINNGQIIGMGGDGGIAADPTAAPPLSGAGYPGGTAMTVNMDATVVNNGYIFGGGGGGASMAFRVGIQLGPVFLGMLIGSGGGGGAGGGIGGNTPGVIGLFFYSPGLDGTDGLYGVPGPGGILNFPINFALGPVQISLNPNAHGGDGGAYGYPGSQGLFQLTISAGIVINIPFVGPVYVPIVTNLNIPIPVPPPAPGKAGMAIKRNGNIINIPDAPYNTSFIKGRVGP